MGMNPLFLNPRISQLDGKNDLIQIENEEHTDEQIILPPVSEDGLSDDEVAGLLYIREEEKLAHDVYVNFYSQFETRNFQNISQSELNSYSVRKDLDRPLWIDGPGFK